MNSTKSLKEKLAFYKYNRKLVLHAPEAVDVLEGDSHDRSFEEGAYDLIVAFIYTIDEFKPLIAEITRRHAIADGGYVYVAYPKKNNKVYNMFIERDELYHPNYFDENGIVHGTKLKFSRMVSMDDIFTVVGMKVVSEKKRSSPTKNSQRVDDYLSFIPNIKTFLTNEPEVLAIYDNLTAGYQKDWARYIFSAKREETQDKRKNDMMEVLKAGYKTMDLYRRKK
ncbi:YdeI/OmpD-associated family protein [Paenisporosarcina cavernae]|nr:YdeI/OmpD-associated family protein [Paenisporosarcina cavernae]